MKKILITSLVASAFLITTSCGEDFINLAPRSSANADSFYKTKEDMEQAVIAAYAALQSRGSYAQNFLYFMEARSDNSYVEDITKSSGEEGDLDLFREATTNSYLEATWQVCYTGIQRCNIVLGRIDNIGMDDATRNIRKGEVSFIRALTYFNLVRMWGGVPVVTEELTNVAEAYDHTRQSAQQVYELIIEDLTYAVSVLPVKQDQTGRVTKGAALTLLGKVHLTVEQWPAAIEALKQVQTLGYNLQPTFSDIFDYTKENNTESIFEIQFKSGGVEEGSLFLRLHTPLNNTTLLGGIGAGGVGDNLPTQDLNDAFTADDKRKPITVGILPDGRRYTGKFTAKPFNTNDEDNNFIVLRYADVLLMLAEALNKQSYVGNGEAFGYLNEIRTRAGLSNLTADELPDKNAFHDAVIQERRLELAFENHRWFDLVRTGKAVSVMSAYLEKRAPMTVEAHQTLFPIPQSQVDISPENIKQNPGYPGF